MKYITTQLSLNNQGLHLEPIYIPETYLGEDVYLRVITGNFRSKGLSVIFHSGKDSRKQVMQESYPTVFDYKIQDTDISGIRTDSSISFSFSLFVNIDDNIKQVSSENIVKVLGSKYGKEYSTDIDMLFSKVNSILEAINGNSV